MNLQVNGHNTYCYTGGKPFDAAKPTVIFIHGVVHDHSVWILQTRYFAHHGWNVLAVDLPGHCRSQGPAPSSVQDAADFIIALADAAGLQTVVLVGHSFGSLIALEAASRAPGRISQLVLVGTAFPMKVSAQLLEASLNTPEVALKITNVLSRSTLAPPPSALGPGTWIYDASLALSRRVIASNPHTNLFYTGFKACDSYTHGELAMDAVACPVLFVLGRSDQMTPPKGAQSLIAHARLRTGATTEVVELDVGHHQMTEAPEAMLAALKGFLRA